MRRAALRPANGLRLAPLRRQSARASLRSGTRRDSSRSRRYCSVATKQKAYGSITASASARPIGAGTATGTAPRRRAPAIRRRRKHRQPVADDRLQLVSAARRLANSAVGALASWKTYERWRPPSASEQRGIAHSRGEQHAELHLRIRQRVRQALRRRVLIEILRRGLVDDVEELYRRRWRRLPRSPPSSRPRIRRPMRRAPAKRSSGSPETTHGLPHGRRALVGPSPLPGSRRRHRLQYQREEPADEWNEVGEHQHAVIGEQQHDPGEARPAKQRVAVLEPRRSARRRMARVRDAVGGYAHSRSGSARRCSAITQDPLVLGRIVHA